MAVGAYTPRPGESAYFLEGVIMKIKYTWEAFTNISFKGEKIIERDKEDWAYMSDKDKLEEVLELCGFSWNVEELEEQLVCKE